LHSGKINKILSFLAFLEAKASVGQEKKNGNIVCVLFFQSRGLRKKRKYSLYPRLWAEELYCDIRGLQIKYS
jgi:hypothetical protein